MFSSFKCIEPLFFELSCTQTERHTHRHTHTHTEKDGRTDGDEYSIVAVYIHSASPPQSHIYIKLLGVLLVMHVVTELLSKHYTSSFCKLLYALFCNN